MGQKLKLTGIEGHQQKSNQLLNFTQKSMGVGHWWPLLVPELFD